MKPYQALTFKTTTALEKQKNNYAQKDDLDAQQRQRSDNIQDYLDMHHLNPDWKFATNHGNAAKAGDTRNLQIKQQCICCLRQINKTPVPLCANSKQLQFLGSGFPLFFIYVKFVLILLLLLIFSQTFLSLFWAITQNTSFCIDNVPLIIDQKQIKCSSYMVLFSRIEGKVHPSEQILRLSSFIIILLALLYMRDRLRKINEYYDERSISYSDFSIIIQNLPSKEQIKEISIQRQSIGQLLTQFFKDKQIFNKQLVPIKYIFIGNIQQMEKHLHKRKTIAEEMKQVQIQFKIKEQQENMYSQKLKQQKHYMIQSCKKLDNQIDKWKQEIKSHRNQLKNEIEKKTIQCDKVIVCFNLQEERENAQECFLNAQSSDLQKYFGSKTSDITFARAPEPYEINWQNINIQNKQHVKRLIISWTIFVIILGSLSVVFYFLLKFKSHEIELGFEHAKQDPHLASSYESKARAVVFCSLILIIFFNKFILAFAIHHLIQYESHVTGAAVQYALCLKYTLGLFFTTALMTLLVEGASYNNVFHSDYGIVQQETIMFFFSSFMVPLIWLINPWYIYKWIQRRLNYGSIYVTQEAANKLMEDPQYLMGKRYGQVLQTIWFTYLYSCVIPFGSMLVFIGTSFFYWIDKYNLLRKSSVFEGVAGGLSMKALKLLQFILILKPAGELIFDKMLRNQWHVISVVQLCIAGVYIVLPMNDILDYFHEEHFYGTNKTLSEIQDINIQTYEIFNPITKDIEIRRHFQKIMLSESSEKDKKENQKSLKQQLLSPAKIHHKIKTGHKSKHTLSRPRSNKKISDQLDVTSQKLEQKMNI